MTIHQFSISEIFEKIGTKGKRQTFLTKIGKTFHKQKVTLPLRHYRRMFDELGYIKCLHCDKLATHFRYSRTKGIQLCTHDGLMTLDHIIPQAVGGQQLDNISIMCSQCNSNKGCYLLEKDPRINIRSYFNKSFKDINSEIIDDINNILKISFKSRAMTKHNSMFNFDEANKLFKIISDKTGHIFDINDIPITYIH